MVENPEQQNKPELQNKEGSAGASETEDIDAQDVAQATVEGAGSEEETE